MKWEVMNYIFVAKAWWILQRGREMTVVNTYFKERIRITRWRKKGEKYANT